MAKGLYRAPSNLPELLVVVLCKRPHFLTIAPAVLCLTARREEAEEHALSAKSRRAPRPVCSCTAYVAPGERRARFLVRTRSFRMSAPYISVTTWTTFLPVSGLFRKNMKHLETRRILYLPLPRFV